MRPIYSAVSSSMPAHILCYLCEGCYCSLFDEWEIDESMYERKKGGRLEWPVG